MEIVIFFIGLVVGSASMLAYRFSQRSKKAFFKNEITQTTRNIWGLEFSVFTTRIRLENTRLLLTRGEDQIVHLNEQIEANKDDDKLRAKLEDDKTKLESQLEQLRRTMDDLNVILNGANVSEAFPEGIMGTQNRLEEQVQKRENLKQFIKFNC